MDDTNIRYIHTAMQSGHYTKEQRINQGVSVMSDRIALLSRSNEICIYLEVCGNFGGLSSYYIRSAPSCER